VCESHDSRRPGVNEQSFTPADVDQLSLKKKKKKKKKNSISCIKAGSTSAGVNTVHSHRPTNIISLKIILPS
jgi:hypothetical protein